MTDHADLLDFAANFHQEVISHAEIEGSENFRSNAFTALVVDALVNAGELEDGEICYLKTPKFEVSGYYLNTEDERLDLFISRYNALSQPETLSKKQIDGEFRKLIAFLEKANKNYYTDLEPASPAHDMAFNICLNKRNISRVRLFLFTDGLTKLDKYPSVKLDEMNISFHVWDIERLYRCMTSGQGRESIFINLADQYGGALPCLTGPSTAHEYQAYLAVLPGRVLFDLYEEYGARLLEFNVRSFLQVRGKVNKGIRDTILKEPERFLAYNNGISAIAESVELATLPDGGKGIVSIRGLQIVNGGQTTASVHNAAKKDKANLASIGVQLKLSVVNEASVSDVVPLISRYANSQNVVNEADFSANDVFHVKLEELSRTVWAPAVDGTQRQTRWFYERARGQFADAKSREATSAKRTQFDAIHPPSQKFTKTDLAKFENAWDMMPELVSRGSQKNFAEFALQLRERSAFSVDQEYFRRLVAKAILFRQTEKIVQAEKFGAYRANIVAYTVAWLAHLTRQRVDLDLIWLQQALSPALRDEVQRMCRVVHRKLVSPPAGKMVTEWCKTRNCWSSLQAAPYEMTMPLMRELVENEHRVERTMPARGQDARRQEAEAIVGVNEAGAEQFMHMIEWARQMARLTPEQRSAARTVMTCLSERRNVPGKKAVIALSALAQAQKMGFRPPGELRVRLG